MEDKKKHNLLLMYVCMLGVLGICNVNRHVYSIRQSNGIVLQALKSLTKRLQTSGFFKTWSLEPL